ncbi:cobalamin biosynthesis protein [Blautia sp. MSJ-19]|nr:cobalamin biosynthesis protein [Blautia sp. MSJ-19]
MQISIICFSLTGYTTAVKLEEGLRKAGSNVLLFKKSRYLEDSITESTGEWTGSHFDADDGIIFVGACGIAVRSIAPYVTSKKSDPAVVVIDECGKFVISLLSGHLGGANELALEAAELLGAVPVVTTATDLHDQFAVDVFAKKNHCEIFNMKAAKEVSAALLAGKSVGFYSEFPYVGKLPEGLQECILEGNCLPEIGVAVTIHSSCRPFASTVQIIPDVVTLGMGCRKNKEADVIIEEASACLEDADIYRQAVEKLTSISIKKKETGLVELAEKWQIPFVTFEENELKDAEGEFTPSEFVKTITGVNNVCERSAVLGAEQGRLIKKKTGRNGVTTALALRNWEVHFE